MNELLKRWTDFIEGAASASEVVLTAKWAEASGTEENGDSWKYYQNADENFIRITGYDTAE
jgi:hypothetical protein